MDKDNSKKSIRKKLEEVESELKAVERKKKHLLHKEQAKRKYEERRKRAHRLIETGALAEKYFEIHNLSISEREELFNMFSEFIKANKPNKYKK